MDLTNLFKSCVKTIRTRNKAMGVTLPQTKIFPSSPTAFSQFYSKAKDIQSNITSHRNLLDDHRKKYLQIEDQSMSDYERTYMEKVEILTNFSSLCFILSSINTFIHVYFFNAGCLYLYFTQQNQINRLLIVTFSFIYPWTVTKFLMYYFSP